MKVCLTFFVFCSFVLMLSGCNNPEKKVEMYTNGLPECPWDEEQEVVAKKSDTFRLWWDQAKYPKLNYKDSIREFEKRNKTKHYLIYANKTYYLPVGVYIINYKKPDRKIGF
mgnify:CR=1 FL=1